MGKLRNGKLLLLIAGIAGLALVVLAAVKFLGEESERPFDSTSWLTGTRAERGKMVDDLMRREVLMRRSRLEVQELLGPPDVMTKDSLVYDVCRGAYFGEGWPWKLVVTFNDSWTEVTVVELVLKLTDFREIDGNLGKRNAADSDDKSCNYNILSKEPPHGYHRSNPADR